MKPFGYITLKEAEAISGISIETFKKQCQSGRIRGAIKEAGSWFVPKDEIIIKPVSVGHSDDNALVLLNMLTSVSGIGLNVTLYTHGLIIEGVMISAKKYINHMQEHTKITLDYEGATTDTEKMVNSTLDTYFVNILKKDEESGGEFVHLEQVSIIRSNGNYEPNGALLRIRLDSIDGFALGTTTTKEMRG